MARVKRIKDWTTLVDNMVSLKSGDLMEIEFSYKKFAIIRLRDAIAEKGK